ncbi:hypothetical protein [Clostridium sp. ZBS20]|uniref:hypothetical protein n=1 Tax=Clostridium sp. ZBS20 TaxID=2949966 RepID=UPI002079BDF5|nr:hypothetical protein [Clostridium sp. ZBS20]
MARINELFKKLKDLTGYSYEMIAKEFGVSKQHIYSSFGNYSLTYSNSNKFMALKITDIKIKEHQAEIEKLENFKKEIMESRMDQ